MSAYTVVGLVIFLTPIAFAIRHAFKAVRGA